MNPFKLSRFEPGLQIQLLLATLFRLQTILNSPHFPPSSLILIKMEEPDSPWLGNLGVLHQLKFQVEHLLLTYPSPLLNKLDKAIELAIEECKIKEIKDNITSCTWPQTLFNLTAEFLNSCEPDENLYYFLLRHQNECKKTFGRVFLINLFKKKHKGLKQTEQFLIDKYQERGFFHLKTLIRKHLASLTQC